MACTCVSMLRNGFQLLPQPALSCECEWCWPAEPQHPNHDVFSHIACSATFYELSQLMVAHHVRAEKALGCRNSTVVFQFVVRVRAPIIKLLSRLSAGFRADYGPSFVRCALVHVLACQPRPAQDTLRHACSSASLPCILCVPMWPLLELDCARNAAWLLSACACVSVAGPGALLPHAL